MKVRDLMNALLECDPDEDVHFLQERHDYGQTRDAILVTRVSHRICGAETIGNWILIEDEPDIEDYSDVENVLVIS